MVLGGLLLFDRSVPDAQVSIGIIAPVAIGSGLFFGFVVKKALAARRLPPAVKSQNVIGAVGSAVTPLDPSGVVQVVSETWSATSSVPLPKGSKVRVTAVDGLRLSVEPAEGAVAEETVPPTQPEESTTKEG
jgi:membrane-bound serine protease (ClpP class)